MIKTVLIGLGLASVLSCALFDSGTPWQSGPYKLTWIDDPASVSLLFTPTKQMSLELVPPQVFAVGIDARYLVAKQHPNGDKSITNFYIVARSFERSSSFDSRALMGPMNAQTYSTQSKALGLPDFSKTFPSLE